MHIRRISVFREFKQSEGFTLIETLVAAMLLAISVVVVLQSFSANLKTLHLTSDYARAVLYAQQKIEEILLSDNCSEGVQEGDFADGYTWHVLIESKEDVDPFTRRVRVPIKQLLVKVYVSWYDGLKEKRFELNTIKQVINDQI